jgi:prepilin-type N-terminal cleavage/methylation domain-containing protein
MAAGLDDPNNLVGRVLAMRKLRTSGFTLLEVLVSMMIVVILIAVMASVITVAFRQKNAAEAAIEAVRDTQAAGELIVNELSNAASPTPSTQPMTGGIETDTSTLGLGNNGTAGGLGSISQNYTPALYGAFYGERSSVSFYTTGSEPKSALKGDAKWVSYSLDKDKDGNPALVRQVETNLLADQQSDSLPTEVLIMHVRQVIFKYWDGTQWLDSWDSTVNSDTLPYAVSIELTLDPSRTGGDERVIKRFASLWCAAPPATLPDTSSTDLTTVTPGL